MPKFLEKSRAASQPKLWRRGALLKLISLGRGNASIGPNLPHVETLTEILAERARIHAEFEQTARAGYVPADALIARLYNNYRDELANERQLLGQLETALEALLRKLEAQFPEPSAPVAELPPPPRARRFGPIGDHWALPAPDPLH